MSSLRWDEFKDEPYLTFAGFDDFCLTAARHGDEEDLVRSYSSLSPMLGKLS
jgi:hypothetical protein